MQIVLPPLCIMIYSIHIISYIIFVMANSCLCWDFYPSMTDFNFKDAMPDAEPSQLEYVYGKCEPKDILYAEDHWSSDEVDGKFFLTGWLNITSSPKCIILRGIAQNSDVDLFRTTAYSFQICVPKITYIHSQRRWLYFFYEWIIPHDLASGIDWDIYFFGTTKFEWLE